MREQFGDVLNNWYCNGCGEYVELHATGGKQCSRDVYLCNECGYENIYDPGCFCTKCGTDLDSRGTVARSFNFDYGYNGVYKWDDEWVCGCCSHRQIVRESN